MGKISKSAVPAFILTVLWLFALPAQGQYNGGSGDPCDPYQINDPCQMNAIGLDPCDWDKHFILTADIDLSAYTGEQFNIIAPDTNDATSGFQGTKFTGSFDGNGHIITNFTYSAMNTDYIGLFGCVGDGAEIKDLGITDVSISGDDCLGGLVGKNYYGGISNCYANGTVTGGYDSDYFGGLVGINSGSISNCYTTGSVSGNDFLGGLVGLNLCSINNCYATGTVSGDFRLGGLVGHNVNGSISNCYATGSVSGYINLGGLVGSNRDGSINNSFWDIETSRISISDGGTGLNTEQMQNINTFLNDGWDFIDETANGTEDIWWMPEIGYPALTFQSEVTVPDIMGMNQTDALNTIIAVGLTLGGINGLYSSTIPVGIIIDQFPPAGTIVVEYYFINMIVSLGPYPYAGGTGDPCDPYQINDPCQLNAIGLNHFDWDKHFILTADIDLAAYTGTQFNIIAPDANDVESGFQGIKFTGSFDGNGHTVINFTYTTTGGSYIGLFGCLGSSGEIKDLGMTNVSVSGDDYLGGLVGYNYFGSISNCYATGSVSGDKYLGGLVGYNYYNYRSISNCYATGSVSGKEYLGGLLGYNDNGSISNCYATTDVSGVNESCYLGGLVGWNEFGSIRNAYATGTVNGEEYLGGLVGKDYGSISNCYATGSVSGGVDSLYLGGLVGCNAFGNISVCYATGIVSGGDDSLHLGGLVGSNYYSCISNCYAAGSVSSGNYSDCLGGLVGFNYEGSISNCYATGSVNGDDYLGGLVGNNYGSISNCFATGSVTGRDNSSFLGGLVGYNNDPGIISDCYATCTVIGGNNYSGLGGLVGRNYKGKIINCFATGSVSGGVGSWDVGGLVGSDCYGY
ncbi:MAG: PASTA domain-containing protein, partial [Sedimentisphaerales bacterium]|nr:PASTA domain-containing protein [Sedimentisphaerales bacterium]